MSKIRVVIVEDEKPAARNLERKLLKADVEIEILNVLSSVKEATEWFTLHTADLIFMDIELGDGQSFKIFEHANIEAPVIFTTAYDQYAIKAFKANGIAYLLKPVDDSELIEAITKFRKYTQPSTSMDAIRQLLSTYKTTPEYKQRFMIQVGSRIKSVPVAEIAYFFFVEKSVFICTSGNKHLPVDHSLEKLEEMLDPDKFFRINRRMLVSIDAISQIYSLSKSRIKLELQPAFDEEVLVSFNKTPAFRNWLNK